MTQRIAFVTGNPRKIEEATAVLADYGIGVEPVALTIDEIQHANPLKITEHKVKAAYQQLQRPAVVNDSSWDIPALDGFPGGYMKDVAKWFRPEDFLALMRDKADRRVILHDVVAYYDGERLELFQFDQEGVFVEHPRGDGLSMNRVVSMKNGNDLTIAEEFAQRGNGERINPAAYHHWQLFGEWYKGQS